MFRTIKRLFGSGKASEVQKEETLEKQTRQGLAKTKRRFLPSLTKVFGSNREQQAVADELEALLYSTDLGPQLVDEFMQSLKGLRKPWQLAEVIATWKPLVRQKLTATVEVEQSQAPSDTQEPPQVMLMVGVNGTGKTTSIAKIANLFKNQGKKVMLAAADTYRAAAVEQLEIWAERLGITCIKGQEGGDPSAVAFDAVNAAKSRHIDLLIIDTAGRLHTDSSLVNALVKMKRTVAKANGRDPDEILLTLDANTGQNGIQQAMSFHEALKLTGLVLTKLDSSAKGGAVVSIVDRLQLPIAFIGTGEKIEDISLFDEQTFAEALFDNGSENIPQHT